MKVLVTGATGHLGRQVVARLSRSGHELVAVSRSGAAPAPAFGVPDPSARARGLAVDLRLDAAVSSLASEIDRSVAVVHLAAWHPPATAATGPPERRVLLEVNVHGTLRLLEAIRLAGGAHCVVYASTFEVYAELEPGTAEIGESSRLAPRSDYGATKLSGEDHCAVFAAEEGVRTVALRMPAVYGPGERTPRALPNFLQAVARGERPTIYGDGADLRDQLHVRDAAETLALAIESGASGAFNVTDGKHHSIADLARTAMAIAGIAGEPAVKPRTKPRYDYPLSTARARRELGFTAAVPLDAGMREQLAWIRAGSPN